MAKKRTHAAKLDVVVDFGGLSADKTVGIGVKIDRAQITLNHAEKHLCGRRLTGTIIANDGDQADQGRIPGMENELEIEGTFDVKSFSVHPEHLSARLVFAKKEIDLAKLGDFTKRKGRMVVDDVEGIPEAEKNGSEDDEE